MTVKVEEFVKIRNVEGKEFEGKALAQDLVVIELEDKTLVYGLVTGISKVRTTIVCDAGADCYNSYVDSDMKTVPKTIQFDETGNNSAGFIKEVTDVVITTNITGEKKAYCCAKCAAAVLKKSNIVEFPSGKGKRTFDTLPETQPVETATLVGEE